MIKLTIHNKQLFIRWFIQKFPLHNSEWSQKEEKVNNFLLKPFNIVMGQLVSYYKEEHNYDIKLDLKNRRDDFCIKFGGPDNGVVIESKSLEDVYHKAFERADVMVNDFKEIIKAR